MPRRARPIYDQRLTELSALHAIGLVLSSTLEVEQLVEQGLNAIVDQLGYNRAVLFLVDDTQQALVHGRVAGACETVRARVREAAPSTSRGGQPARQGGSERRVRPGGGCEANQRPG